MISGSYPPKIRLISEGIINKVSRYFDIAARWMVVAIMAVVMTNVIVVTAMGVITPPVGINAYVIKGVIRDVPLEKIFSGIWPFLLACIITTLILVAFPPLTTFLPNLLMK